MAGYGSEVIAPRWTDQLIRVLLRAAKRRAREFETLEMSFSRRSTSSDLSAWAIDIDGNGWLIAAWSQQLERELPIVAEGFASGIPTRQAVLIANSLVARWHHLIVPDDHFHRDPYRIRTTVRDGSTHIWPLLDWPESHELTSRLIMSDDLIARWLANDLPEEVAIEEIHTMSERALRIITDSGQRVPYVAMIDRAVEAGKLRETSAELLRGFNETRRQFRHRGRELADDEERRRLRAEILEAFYVLDKLLEQFDG